jgi:hypothetical protein
MATPITKTDTYEQTRGVADKLGCMDVETPKGICHIHDAPGVLTVEISGDGRVPSVGIMLYDPEPQTVSGKGVGFISQLDAGSARNVAASLLRMADRLDGGATKQ